MQVMSKARKQTVGLIVFAFTVGFALSWLTSMAMREQRSATMEQGEEIVSGLSPDESYRARVWLPGLGGLGATVSQPHQVWLENVKGISESRLMFEADKTDEVRVKWRMPLELEICYSDAQVSYFSNRYVSVDRTSGIAQARTVEIVLRKAKQLNEC
jgi:hypothetical protein